MSFREGLSLVISELMQTREDAIFYGVLLTMLLICIALLAGIAISSIKQSSFIRKE